jgi:hypothetical protein
MVGGSPYALRRDTIGTKPYMGEAADSEGCGDSSVACHLPCQQTEGVFGNRRIALLRGESLKSKQVNARLE